MTALVRDTIRRNKMREANVNSEAATIAELAEKFKRTSDALGSRIRAAYSCSTFEQFLDKEEKAALVAYKYEQEEE